MFLLQSPLPPPQKKSVLFLWCSVVDTKYHCLLVETPVHLMGFVGQLKNFPSSWSALWHFLLFRGRHGHVWAAAIFDDSHVPWKKVPKPPGTIMLYIPGPVYMDADHVLVSCMLTPSHTQDHLSIANMQCAAPPYPSNTGQAHSDSVSLRCWGLLIPA